MLTKQLAIKYVTMHLSSKSYAIPILEEEITLDRISGPYAEILQGGLYFNLVGNPRCGGLGVQPPDADKIVIFQHSKYG